MRKTLFYNTMHFILLSVLLVTSCIGQGVNIELKGGADIGYYTLDVMVGTPPQKQSLILDTGSNLMIIPCQGCSYCNINHENPIFEPNNSTSLEQLTDHSDYYNWKCRLLKD